MNPLNSLILCRAGSCKTARSIKINVLCFSLSFVFFKILFIFFTVSVVLLLQRKSVHLKNSAEQAVE